jgi:DNA-binding NtrC family response regulator
MFVICGASGRGLQPAGGMIIAPGTPGFDSGFFLNQGRAFHWDAMKHQTMILVVDYEAQSRTMLCETLENKGYGVDAAASGSQALAMFQATGYRLVLAAWHMPELSGLALLKEIKRLAPKVPLVMVAAQGTVSDAVAAIQAGASDFILKPLCAETVEAVVGNALSLAARDGSSNAAPDYSKNAKVIITQDPQLLSVLNLAQSVAPSNATVLVQGESGTGKELMAAFIHHHSGRGEEPYVALNCAALPDTLAESELFGHEKGAFTGAVSRKIGKFEQAGYGTVVLDEISELALPLQAKLLRVLQEREIDRIGGTRPVPVHARVVAISNVNLEQAVEEGKFREDLYFRINVVPISIPPLRERVRDIPVLVRHFLQTYCTVNRKPLMKVTDDAMEMLCSQEWKGNVRELQNVMERAVLVCNQADIQPQHLFLSRIENPVGPSARPFPVRTGLTVREMEKRLITETLKNVNDNRTRAAELLGISIRTLRNKLREYRGDTEAVAVVR